MTLTVRLKPEIESALELHCAEHGVSKSLVVQQVLAEFLARPARPGTGKAAMPDQPGAAYLAFERSGLIGGGESNGRSATKEVVRERIREHFEAKRARRA